MLEILVGIFKQNHEDNLVVSPADLCVCNWLSLQYQICSLHLDLPVPLEIQTLPASIPIAPPMAWVLDELASLVRKQLLSESVVLKALLNIYATKPRS